MATLNLDYYTEEDYYSDGDIENVLLNMVENNINIADVKEISYPIIYHLSPVRENILNWYPFDKNASLLEIGSGCGAITGMLCSKVKNVVSVELSKRRATINYTRNREVDNLTIYVGNQNDMDFGQKFDYIVLNGVFEYAMSFTDSENSYVDFLKNISKNLAEDGKLMIAIENKYGLKYFAGAPEDHTNQYFLGLNDYVDNHSVRTFGKTELTEILLQGGFGHTQFYYPYPDYKFPNEIFTDESLQSNGYGRDYFNLNGDRYLLFNEAGVARGLVKEGVMSALVNSFLVVASKEEFVEQKKIIYAKINNDRKEQFRLLTQICEIDGEKWVVKYPITENAQIHINRMIANTTKKTGKLRCVSSTTSQNIFEYQYIAQKTLNNEIKECIEKKSIDNVLRLLADFFAAAFSDAVDEDYDSVEFQQVFGNETTGNSELCISNANIDLICDNVFRIDGEYYVIDCEWIFSFPIPINFIKWRTINELYNKYSKLLKLMPRDEMLGYFGIDKASDEVFAHWNYHFSKEYVGSDSLERYSITKDELPINNLMDNDNIITKAHSYLYLDCGSGYNENDKISSVLRVRNSEFKVSFHLPSGSSVKNLRWDPMERRLLRIKITHIEADAEVVLRPDNGILAEDGFEDFLSFDPRYCIEVVSGQLTELSIVGLLEYVNETQMQEIKKTVDYLPVLKSEYNDVERKYNDVERKYNDVENKYEMECARNDNLISEFNRMEELQKKYALILKSEYDDMEQKYKSECAYNDDLESEIKCLEKVILELKKRNESKEETIKLLEERNSKEEYSCTKKKHTFRRFRDVGGKKLW